MTSVLFSLRATLGFGSEEDSRKALNAVCTPPPSQGWSFFEFGIFTSNTAATPKKSDKRVFVASASEIQLFVDDQNISSSHRKNDVTLAAIFVPPALVEEVFQKFTSSNHEHANGSSFWLDESSSLNVTENLLPKIHIDLSECTIRGIILTTIASEMSATAEIVLIDLANAGKTFADLVNATNGQCMTRQQDTIIKILPISEIQFCSIKQSRQMADKSKKPCLPTCPICLHRIDTARLGLPKPRNEDLCSRFCPFPGVSVNSRTVDCRDFCARQRCMKRWPSPSRCEPCTVIDHYWQQTKNELADLFCAECAMPKTLWVCLTCGFVGCGRYSNKHSVAHFQDTGHPYSLELATLRIWDYEDGEAGGYAHRTDLLDCPSSPPLALPWMASCESTSDATGAQSLRAGVAHLRHEQYLPNEPNMDVEKSPKKAVMIGEEYEALLYSALEDQAQYYDGEMVRLRAELSASLTDERTMTAKEHAEVEQLREEISNIRSDIDGVGRHLLDAQAQEAGHRASSQKLLREQQVANDVLKKLQEEARSESEGGKLQIQDLEQQVADLKTNLQIRQRFSQNEELSNAQIFGTGGSETKPASRRGKKKGRSRK